MKDKTIKTLLITASIAATILAIALTLTTISPKASAQQPTKTIITQVHINMYFPTPGEPWDYYYNAHYIEHYNNTAGLYDVCIVFWYRDEGTWTEMQQGFIPDTNTRLMININLTVYDVNTKFDENVNIIINGSTISAFLATAGTLQVTDEQVSFGGAEYQQQHTQTNLKPMGVQLPPTYTTVTELPDTTVIVNPPQITVELPETLTPSNTATTEAKHISDTIIKRIPPTGLEAVIIDLFGQYNPIEKITTYTQAQSLVTINEDGTSQITRIVEPVSTIEYGINYEWFVGVIFFAIILYSFFRCIGGVLKWK
jgi:hypothetical protein